MIDYSYQYQLWSWTELQPVNTPLSVGIYKKNFEKSWPSSIYHHQILVCAYRYTCEPCYRYINTLIHQHILGYSTSTTTAHPHCCISLSLHHLGSKPVSLFAAIIYTNTSFAKDNLNQFFVQNFSQTPMSYKELLILLQSVSNIETRVITDY